MRGRIYIVLAILLILVAVLAQFWPFDRTPPDVRIQPDPGRYTEPIKVQLFTEEGGRLFLAAGEADPMPYVGPLTLKRPAVIRYYAEDKYGNRSPVGTARYEIRLDNEPPVTVASPAGDKFYHPVSVRLTSEPGAVIRYTTDGRRPDDSSPVYREAISLRKETVLQFFAVDEAGNREEARTERYVIVIDTSKPVTLAIPSGGLFNAPVTVKLSAEEGSTVYYSLDGKRPTSKSSRYTQPLRFDRSGVLRFYAVDQAGNKEDVREEQYVIDTVPPQVQAQPPPGSFSKPITVTLRSSEPGMIRYETGGPEAGPSSAPYRSPIPLARDTVLSFFAVDRAGNHGTIVQARYVIDTLPPEVVARPPGGNYSGRIRVKLESSEPAKTYFTMDGTQATPASDPYQGPISIERNTTLSFMAVDEVGNRSPVQTQRYILDAEPPVTRAEPPGGSYSKEVRVVLTGEEGAVIRYTTDGTAPTKSSPVYRQPLRLSKESVIKFYGTDASGNEEEVRVERYTFDTTAPTTAIDPPPGIYNRPVKVSLKAEGGGKILLRRGPGKEFAAYDGPFVVNRTETIAFYSVDEIGNKEGVQEAAFVIDTEPPVTTPYPAPGTYNPPIRLELRTEAGARIHYTLDGTEPSEASPAYKVPLSLTDAVTVRYFAVDEGGNRERVKSASYRVASGIWRDNTNGVFIHPSVIDGDLLWIGGEEGLFRVNIDSKRRKNYTTSSGLISNSVRAITVDRLGFKWIGTDRGLCQFDGNSTWVTYDYSDGLPSNVINFATVGPADNLWLGTDKGLAVFDGKKFSVRTEKQGLPDDNVTALAIDANGVFWIGTRKGLLRQEEEGSQVFTVADGLPSDQILSLAVDGRWNIWVGTDGQGIARFDGRKWTRFAGADGIPAKTVMVITTDLADNVWFGTQSGVYKYDGSRFTKITTETY